MIFMPLLAAGVQHLLAVQDMRCRVNDMSCLPLIAGVQHSVAVQDMRKAGELNLSADAQGAFFDKESHYSFPAGKAYLIKQCPASVHTNRLSHMDLQDALQKAKNIKKQNQSYVSIAIVIVCYAIICVRSHLL